MTQEEYHVPVLLPEALEALDIKPGGIYVDATFGGGGHSRAIMERLSTEGHLYSFDQDEDAVSRAWKDERFTIVYSNFRYLRNFMRYYGVEYVDGILADLGVSSHHFDAAERGFSFRWDGPLDMRMNRHAAISAADLLKTVGEERLAEILKLYGELPTARKIASAIVKARAEEPVTTVERLLKIVTPLINPRQEKKELAMVFQALRIEVNHELDALREFLSQALAEMRPGGRLVVITYHSLEDRLVKNFMRTGNIEGRQEKDFYGRVTSDIKPLMSKPIVPSPLELETNPRSRSAKMRVAVKK